VTINYFYSSHSDESTAHATDDKERSMAETGADLLDPPAPEIGAGADRGPEGDERDDVVAADLLVEEISIDGMCGVY
jgi:mycofactocin precursor